MPEAQRSSNRGGPRHLESTSVTNGRASDGVLFPVTVVLMNVANPAASLERLAETGQPVLVAFVARWSTPARLLAPELERLRASWPVVDVDTDEHPALADRFAVVSLPTFVISYGGEEIRRYIGAVSAADLEAGLIHAQIQADGKGGSAR